MNLFNADKIDLSIIKKEFWYIDGNGKFKKLPFSGTMNTPIGLFAQIDDSIPVTNTTNKESLIGSGVGSLIVPSNGFQVGDSFHLKMGGIITCIQNETIDFHIESNGVVLIDSNPLELSASTNKGWELELDFTIRAVGAEGIASIKSNGQFVYNKNSNNVYEGITFNTVNNSTFSTEVENQLQVLVQWGTSSTSNSIFSSSANLYRTFYSLNYNV